MRRIGAEAHMLENAAALAGLTFDTNLEKPPEIEVYDAMLWDPCCRRKSSPLQPSSPPRLKAKGLALL